MKALKTELPSGSLPEKTVVSLDHGSFSAWFGLGGTNSQLKLSGINRERKDDEIVLYGYQFGRTTLVENKGTDILLSKCTRASKNRFASIVCENLEIVDHASDSRIPAGGYIVSIGPAEIKRKKLLLYDLQLYQQGKNKKKSF